MKKKIKLVGWSILGILLIAVATLLLARFVFNKQVEAYLCNSLKNEMVEKLKDAGKYVPDTTSYNFAYQKDSVQSQKIREYFKLDTVVSFIVVTIATSFNTHGGYSFTTTCIEHSLGFTKLFFLLFHRCRIAPSGSGFYRYEIVDALFVKLEVNTFSGRLVSTTNIATPSIQLPKMLSSADDIVAAAMLSTIPPAVTIFLALNI